MISLTRILDFCLAESIQGTADEKLLLKSRILVGVSLMYFSSMASLMITLLLMAALHIITVWPAIISCACSSTCYLFQILYFKKTGNQVFAATMTMCILLFFTSVFTYLTGGWNSPLLLFLFVVPMYAFLIAGYRNGIFFTAATVAMYAALGAMQYRGIETPHVISEKYDTLLGYFSWVFSWAMIVGGVTLYSSTVNKLNQSINAEKEKIKFKATFDKESNTYSRKSFKQLLTTKTNDLASSGKSFALVFMELTPNNESSTINTHETLNVFLDALKKELEDQVILSRYSSLSVTALITEQQNNEYARSMLQQLYFDLQKIMAKYDMTLHLGAVVSTSNFTNINLIASDARDALLNAKRQAEKFTVYSRGEREAFEKNYLSNIKVESFDSITKRNL